MCLILHCPEGLEPPANWLENAQEMNPDGWGIMTLLNGEPYFRRGLEKSAFATMLKKFEGKEKTLHFRFATKGDVIVENSHPFRVLSKQKHGEEILLMHNGTFPGKISNPKMSDTWQFAQDMKKLLLKDKNILDTTFTAIFNKVARGDKLTILTKKGFQFFGAFTELQGFKLSNVYSIFDNSKYSYLSKWKDDYYGDYVPAPYTAANVEKYISGGDNQHFIPRGLNLAEHFAGMNYEELVEYIQRNPEDVAEFILDTI